MAPRSHHDPVISQRLMVIMDIIIKTSLSHLYFHLSCLWFSSLMPFFFSPGLICFWILRSLLSDIWTDIWYFIMDFFILNLVPRSASQPAIPRISSSNSVDKTANTPYPARTSQSETATPVTTPQTETKAGLFFRIFKSKSQENSAANKPKVGEYFRFVPVTKYIFYINFFTCNC